MTSELEDAGSAYFRELIALVTNHKDWELDDQFCSSVETAVSQAATGTGSTTGELRYHHTETPGGLYLRFPSCGSPVSALEALLEQPLDPGLDRIDSSLATKLGYTHQQIAEHHATPYITVEPDAYTILTVRIPVDYRKPLVINSLDAVSTVSQEILEFHTEVTEAVDTEY